MKPGVLFLLMLGGVPLAQGQLSLLPGDAAVLPAASNQSAPFISPGGSMMLAVWADNRADPVGAYSWSEYETSRDIYGIRLDANGAMLDAVPMAIAAERAIQDAPKAAWNGSNWLVVFKSVDLNGTGYYYQDSLEAVRVSQTGEVLDPKPIKLYGLTPSGAGYWDVASDGNNWVVVNQGTSTSGDIVAVRISPAGVMLDPPNRALVQATYYMFSNILIAYADGVFLLTYNDSVGSGGYYTKAVRFDSNLNVLDVGPIPFLVAPVSALAGNDSGFYAVWNRQEPDYSVHVVGSRVSTAGVCLDGNGTNISGTLQPYGYAATSAAWDGTNWAITWGEYSTTYIARVNTSGSLIGPGSVPLPGVSSGSIASTGTGAVQFAWAASNGWDGEVWSAHISPANEAGPAQVLSVGAAQQLRPDIAAGDNGFMFVYRSNANYQIRVMAHPLDAAGNPLLAEPVQLDSGPTSNGPGSPSVAWNGSFFMVTWNTASGIVAQRLTPAGGLVDAAPFMVMTGGLGPTDVAALGTDFLVTGRKVAGYVQYISPVAARVSGDGTVLDASPMWLGMSYVRTAPAVVAIGGRWLVAWHRNTSHDSPYSASMGAFVPPVGAPTAEFMIHGPFSTAGGNGIFEVGLASNGTTALFVQSQELTSGVENDMLCRTIDGAGTVGPQINLTPWSGNQYRPRVAWDGSNFVIAYQDQKNRLAPWTLDQLDSRSDLYAMRVSENGTKIDPQGLLFSASPMAETDPTVEALNGNIILAAAMMTSDNATENYRIAYDIIPAERPVAVINPSVTTGDVPLSVDFNSTGSTGLTYAWDFGDGSGSMLENPAHTFAIAGEHLVTLTVTDAGGRQSTQGQLINATLPNQIPVAVATADTYAGVLPLDVVFYAAGSYDPDGFIGNVEWLFSDGGSYWGATAYHTFYTPGPQTVTLNCYDGRGGVGTTSLVINAPGVNLPPIAIASATPTSGYAPLVVQFSSLGSLDADGTIVQYLWTFGDGSGVTSNEEDPVHTYPSSGSYTATLTVWDNEGASQSDTVNIDLFVAHHVEYGLNLSLGPIYIEQYEQGELPVGPIDREAVIDGYGRIAGVANVGYGVNKARVDLAGTNPDDPLWFEYGFATSRYWDLFQIDDPLLEGTHGFFEVTLFVAGSGFVDLSDGYLQSLDTQFDAFWHAVINISVEGVTDPWGGGIQSVYYAGQWYKDYDSTTLEYYGDPLNTYQQTATIEFIYGEPIFMDAFLQVDTRFDNQTASVAGTLDTVIDLGNSSYWGGIRNLRDAQGNPVTTATFMSSSGFDYQESAYTCSNQPYGDLVPHGGDGVVDVDDILYILSAFTNPETAPGGDIHPCGGNGVIDVDDLLAVLDAFMGTYACSNPCPS